MRISDWSSDVCSSDLRVAVAGEEHAVEQALRRQGGDRRMLRVEHQQVGAPAGFQRADRPAEGLGAAGEGLAVEALADRSVVAFSGKHVAALPGEALAVLEPAQILDGADRDVAVGAEDRKSTRLNSSH